MANTFHKAITGEEEGQLLCNCLPLSCFNRAFAFGTHPWSCLKSREKALTDKREKKRNVIWTRIIRAAQRQTTNREMHWVTYINTNIYIHTHSHIFGERHRYRDRDILRQERQERQRDRETSERQRGRGTETETERWRQRH